MTRDEFIQLLERLLAEAEITVHDAVEMKHTDGTPMMDEHGEQVINDVVVVGDGQLYIERDGNEPEGEQAIIDLLANLYDFLPDIIQAMKAEA